MKKLSFVSLATLLSLIFVELGCFVLLSLALGSLATPGRLHKAAASRLEDEMVEFAPEPGGDDWQRHRIAIPQVLHPYLGYVHDPASSPLAASRELSRQAAEHGFALNRRDLFAPAERDGISIAVFGGSFAADIAAGGRWLERKLAEFSPLFRRRSPRVLALAVAGYKQPQQLIALTYLLALGFEPDVVINLDGFNEVALPAVTNVPLGYSAFYPRGWPLMAGRFDQDQIRSIGELTFLKKKRAARALDYLAPPFRWSFFAAAIWRLLDNVSTRRITDLELSIETQWDSNELSFQQRGPRPKYRSQEAMFEDLVEHWQESSRLMHGLCRSQGIRYFHFLQPNQYLPGSKPLSREERQEHYLAEHPYRHAVEMAYPTLIEAGRQLRDEGVDFFDLTDLFADREETIYRDSCCHVNSLGRTLVAQAIAQAIEAEIDSERDPG